MKGVLLCGGKGTRLYPLTKVINKHLIPVGNKPMIYYGLDKMKEAGITEVLIVTGIQQCGTIIEQCGDGKDWNLNLTYKVQTEAGGIAQALLLAENFAANEPILVILGDNIFSMDFTNITKNYDNSYIGATIFLKEVEDPQRFGVAEIYRKMSMYNNEVRVTSIVEKPKEPKSKYAVTGIYIYDKTVFNRIKTLKKSARNELEITDLNNLYLNDCLLTAKLMKDIDWWTDAGTFESLANATNLVKIKNI